MCVTPGGWATGSAGATTYLLGLGLGLMVGPRASGAKPQRLVGSAFTTSRLQGVPVTMPADLRGHRIVSDLVSCLAWPSRLAVRWLGTRAQTS